MKKNNNIQPQYLQKCPMELSDVQRHRYLFWETQPVQKFDEICSKLEQIKKIQKKDLPLYLPNTTQWLEINMLNDEVLIKIGKFLKLYYNDDKKNKYTIDYTPEFLKFIIGTDGIMIAITKKTDNSICGVIGASIKKLVIFDKLEKTGIVHFLCAHPVFREKKITHTLINEIARRLNIIDVNIGCFFTDKCVPTPITRIRYYYRPINYLKLQQNNFIDIGGNGENLHDKFIIKKEISQNYFQLTDADIPFIHDIYIKYMTKFNIYCDYNLTKFTEIINNSMVKTYVIKNNNKIIDFISYYKLSLSKYNIANQQINSGYLFLHSCLEINIDEMLENLLYIAQINNIDIMNVSDIMEISNALLSKELEKNESSDTDDYEKVYEHKFLKSTEKMYFNFFNWKCPNILPKQLALF